MDNTIIQTPSDPGDTIATEYIAGVKYPLSKIILGDHGENDGPVSEDNPLPITDPTIGTTTDTAITSDVNGSLSGKIRGLVKMIADMWDNTNHAIKTNPLPLKYEIDTVTSYDATDYVMVGTTAVSIKTAIANIAASQTDASIIAAVTNKRLKIIGLVIQTGAVATDITFNTKSGGAGVAISPKFANAANLPLVLPHNPTGWFITTSGQGLTVTTGTGSITGILVKYIEVT